ncbi:MAG: glycosyltransferase family 9 protein [Thermodesulfovibrionales bacterium]|nr:glycosyltransferase family 9 protein [Thermodesulfovibrionales bacterium]
MDFKGKPPEKILVIKPSSLGDVIHSLPFLNAIRKCFPGAKLHWIIAKPFGELLEGHPMIDKLWVMDKDQWKKISRARETAGEIKALYKGLRAEGFDIAVDLQGLLRSGLIAAASGAKIRVGLRGFKEAREGSRLFYTHSVDTGGYGPIEKTEAGKYVHAVDRYLRVAEFLGCDISEVRFPLPDAGDKDIGDVLDGGRAPNTAGGRGPYAVMVPGAKWQSKRWPAERFGELAMRLAKDTGIKSLIVGTKADEKTADEIAAASGGSAVSLTGKTGLKELISIIKGARFVVSTDSGPVHIAAALGVPLFALFGPTSHLRTGPYGGRSAIIMSGVPCSPCFKKKCKDLKCMNGISVDMAYNLIMKAV